MTTNLLHNLIEFSQCILHLVPDTKFQNIKFDNFLKSSTTPLVIGNYKNEPTFNAGKFISCLIQFHIISTSISNFSSSVCALDNLVNHRENPDFIIFMETYKTTESKSNKNSVQFYETLNLYSITTLYIVINQLTQFVVCLHCNKTDILQPISGNNISDVTFQWWKLHRNLKGYKIIIQDQLEYEKKRISNECNVKDVEYDTSPRICAEAVIVHRLNSTIISGGKYPMVNRTPITWEIYDIILQDFRLSLLAHPPIFLHLNYITVIDTEGRKASSLWRPYDLLSWCLILVTIVFITLMSYFISTVVKTNENLSILKMAVMAILLLIEQSMKELNRITKFNQRLKLRAWILATFILLAIVISNAYKGILFSTLITIQLPLLPQNLEELSSDSLNLYTISSYRDPDVLVGDVFLSHVRDTFLYEMKNNLNDPVYSELYDKVEFIQKPTATTKESVYMISSLILHSPVKTNKSNRSIAPEFGLLDTEFEVQQMKLALNAFVKNKIVLNGHPHMTDSFTIKWAWIVRHNYFKMVFESILGQLYESGIYWQWTKNYNIFSLRRNLISVKSLLENITLGNYKGPSKILNFILANGVPYDTNKAHATTLQQVEIVFRYLVIAWTISAITLVFERTYKTLWKSIVYRFCINKSKVIPFTTYIE